MENESKLKLIFHKNVFSYRFKPYIFFMSNFYGHCLLWRRSHVAVLLSEWAMVTIEYDALLIHNEVCRVLPDIPRSCLLFVSEHLRSSNAQWRFLRIASNVTRNIGRWSYCFSVPTYRLSRNVLPKTINISQSFQNGAWEKRKLYLAEMS